VVLLLLPAPAVRATVVRVLAGAARIIECATQAEAAAVCGRWRPSVVVVDLRDARGARTDALVRSVRARFPSLPILGCCSLSPRAARDLIAAARAGLDDVVLIGVDDPAQVLHAALRRAAARELRSRVLAQLVPLLSPAVRPGVHYCVEHANRALTVEQLARAFRTTRRTLVRRFTAAGLPAPAQVIGWCRALAAVEALRGSSRSVEWIANANGFPSPSALHNLLRRYTGMRATVLRTRTGSEAAAPTGALR